MLKEISNPECFTDKGISWIMHEGSPQTQHYRNYNTIHYQVFDHRIDYIQNFAKTKFQKFSTSIIKQGPGMCIPLHIDKYHYFTNTNKCDPDAIVRFNIFLEDWKSGHYFEVDNIPIVGWKKGQYVQLNNKLSHRSANVGDQNKYTAQVTGLLL